MPKIVHKRVAELAFNLAHHNIQPFQMLVLSREI